MDPAPGTLREGFTVRSSVPLGGTVTSNVPPSATSAPAGGDRQAGLWESQSHQLGVRLYHGHLHDTRQGQSVERDEPPSPPGAEVSPGSIELPPSPAEGAGVGQPRGQAARSVSSGRTPR